MQWYVITVLNSLMQTDCSTNQSARYMTKFYNDISNVGLRTYLTFRTSFQYHPHFSVFVCTFEQNIPITTLWHEIFLGSNFRRFSNDPRKLDPVKINSWEKKLANFKEIGYKQN